jgi:DNA-binding PadR family transcriptional regulator
MTKFQKRVGKKISPGLIYPFLNLLEEKGLVSIKTEMVGEKERKIYYLTDEGLEFTNKNFKRFAVIISTALEPSLDICAHCGCKVYEGAHKEVIEDKEMIFCCIHCAGHYKQEHEEMSGREQLIR